MRYALPLACPVLLLAVLVWAVPAGAAPERTLRDAHAGLACSECHTGRKAPAQPGAMSCAKCHDPAEVARLTASRGRKNPHVSPHWGTETPCWTCHKEHAKDENYCLLCHAW